MINNFPLDFYRKNTQGVMVYNAAPINCTWGELIKKGRRSNRKFAYPTFGIRGMTSMVTLYWALVLLFEWLPSALCDTVLGLVGAKKRYNELEIYDIPDFHPISRSRIRRLLRDFRYRFRTPALAREGTIEC